MIVPASLGGNEPVSNERNLISGPAQIIPDPRTNKILLVTRPVNIPFLEQMISQLDLTDTFMTPQRRPLKIRARAGHSPRPGSIGRAGQG